MNVGIVWGGKAVPALIAIARLAHYMMLDQKLYGDTTPPPKNMALFDF